MKTKRKNDMFVQFGQAVRKYRMAQGWSQEKLAEKAGLHRTYVADIERGVRNVSLRNLDKLAKAHLTDRVGNYKEIEPYFPLWQSIPVKIGVLAVIAVEHDGVSQNVPRIPKGTDGRAKE